MCNHAVQRARPTRLLRTGSLQRQRVHTKPPRRVGPAPRKVERQIEAERVIDLSGHIYEERHENEVEVTRGDAMAHRMCQTHFNI